MESDYYRMYKESQKEVSYLSNRPESKEKILVELFIEKVRKYESEKDKQSI